ncbi:hypothetical protein [Anaerolentibacter hominis]|uniref:hypothetical protein n=1 Tax=Anaerolentibacter hominis TaxID=3079009 RepID=UPI0031B82D41
MPWCPKCKKEVDEKHLKICPDCATALIFTMEDGKKYQLVTNVKLDNQEDADKFQEFVSYSGIEDTYFEENPTTGLYPFYVRPEDEKQVRKLYVGFRMAKEDAKAKEVKEKEKKEAAQERKSTVYVSAGEKYNDYKSSGYTLIGVGVLAVILIVLNYAGILPIFGGLLPFLVMSAMALGFILAGVSSLSRASRIKGEITEENSITDEIHAWLAENILPDMLTSFEDEELSEEIIVMNKINFIGEKLKEHFPDEEDAFLEELAEEFYDINIEIDT